MGYHAFISYAHEDRETVTWLHRCLSAYWVPGKWRRRIFLDEQCISAEGGLTTSIVRALAESRYLIVCCSQAAKSSPWVDLEVTEFLKTHERSAVLACLVGGTDQDPTSPASIVAIEKELGEELYKPDLRGVPSRVLTPRAVGLLAPLVGHKSKETLLGWRRRVLAVGAATLLVAVVLSCAWVLWVRSDAYQLRRTLQLARATLPSAFTHVQAKWVEVLVRGGDVAEAKSQIRTLPDGVQRSLLWEELARVSLEMGQIQQAKQALEEAKRGAALEADAAERATLIAGIVVPTAGLGQTSEALDLIDSLDGHWRADVLGKLAAPFVQHDQAAAILGRIAQLPATRQRAAARAEVARAQLDAGREGEALATFDGTHDAIEKAHVGLAIASTFAQRRETAKAMSLVRELASLMPARESDWLLELSRAKVLALCGERAEARKMAREALAQLEGIANPMDRNGVAASIADVLLAAGEPSDGFTAAKRIAEGFQRSISLEAVAAYWVESGNAEAALRAAQENQIGFLAEAQSKLVARLVRAGAASTAERLIPTFASVSERGLSGLALVEALLDSKERTSAVSNARRVEGPYFRSAALSAAAAAVDDAGDFELGARLLEEAAASAEAVVDDSARSGARCRVASTQARAGQYRMALAASARCGSSSDQFEVYTAVVRSLSVANTLSSPAP